MPIRIFPHKTLPRPTRPARLFYEALPGFLLRLDARGLSEKRLASPGSPVWARLSGGGGSYAPEEATLGAEYDFEHFSVEAGVDVLRGENFTGSISVRHTEGSAEVKSPIGGGEFDAKGSGVSLGASWSVAGGYYLNGRLSLMDYYVDVSSDKRGQLKENARAFLQSVYFETGRRIAMNEKMKLTPRAWMAYTETSRDRFTDSVNSRISLTGSTRIVAGFGLIAERAHALKGGMFSLRGSLDIEQTLSGKGTTVNVSGESLRSDTASTRVLMSLGSVYRRGRFSFGAEASAGGLGSDDTQFSGFLKFGVTF